MINPQFGFILKIAFTALSDGLRLVNRLCHHFHSNKLLLKDVFSVVGINFFYPE